MKTLFQLLVIIITITSLNTAFGGCVWSQESSSTSSSTPDSEDESPTAGIPIQPQVPPDTVTPNVGVFVETGNLAGANLEASNVKNAAQAYSADNPEAFYFTSDNLVPLYINTTVRAKYHFGYGTGLITRVDSVFGGWANIVFSLSQQKWINGLPDNNHLNDQDIP